jgi:hypothetical protein
MLRQFAFACSEHVSLEDLISGPLRKLAIRRQQMAKAKQLLRGQGVVPSIRGIEGSATFEDIERIRPASRHDAATFAHGAVAHGEIEELLTRYVLARLMGRTVFGEGYYGWSVVQGLGALCLSVAAVGWIARYRAAASGRDSLTFEDVACAIGIVDRAATRVPILGRWSERARVSYLMNDDGLARLFARYAVAEVKTE